MNLSYKAIIWIQKVWNKLHSCLEQQKAMKIEEGSTIYISCK